MGPVEETLGWVRRTEGFVYPLGKGKEDRPSLAFSPATQRGGKDSTSGRRGCAQLKTGLKIFFWLFVELFVDLKKKSDFQERM